MDGHVRKRITDPLGELSFSAPPTNKRKTGSTFEEMYTGFSSLNGANSLSVTGILQNNRDNANHFNADNVSDPSPFGNTSTVVNTLMNIPDPSRDENYILYYRDNGSIKPMTPVFIKRNTLINSSAFEKDVFRSLQKNNTTDSKEADGFDLFTANKFILKNIDFYSSVKKVQQNLKYIGVISDGTQRYDRDAEYGDSTYGFNRYAGVTKLHKKVLEGHMYKDVERGGNEVEYMLGCAIHPDLVQDYTTPEHGEYQEICEYLNDDIIDDDMQDKRAENKNIGELTENSTFYLGCGLLQSVAGFDLHLLLCKGHLQAPRIVNGVRYETLYMFKLWVCKSKVKPDPVIDCGFGEFDIFGNRNSEYNCDKSEKGITIKMGTITSGINGYNNSMPTNDFIMFIQ